MPARNIIRKDIDQAYYHLYARGANKQRIFLTDADKQKFLDLLRRYLSQEQSVSDTGEVYPNYSGRVELLAYCLMDNHFHLFVFQKDAGNVTGMMRSLMTSYVRYFNLKYKRTGSLLESRYKSSHVQNETYLMHISRYIHLNPRSWKYFPYSSINYYRNGEEPDWLHTYRVLDMFADRKEYMKFVYDYEDYKDMLDEIKHDIADL
jgi:putative transposase